MYSGSSTDPGLVLRACSLGLPTVEALFMSNLSEAAVGELVPGEEVRFVVVLWFLSVGRTVW